jgi:ABC-type phosphate transport system substrate-binding protein
MRIRQSVIYSILLVSGLFMTNVAGAQVAVIVNSKSTTAQMTADQVSAIFLGKTRALPGGGVAQPVDLPASAPERDQFYLKVTGKTASQVKAIWSRLVFSGKGLPPKELGTAADVKRFVATNPNAIGYIEKSAVDASVRVVLSVDGR